MKTTLALLALFALVLGGGYWLSAPRGITETEKAPQGASAPSATSSGYTLAQVAGHATAASCWAAIDGGVYDLTSWITQHPGGEARILSICGKDGTSQFMGQHGTDPRAQETLATFRVGALAR